MMGALASALAAETHVCKEAVTAMKPMCHAVGVSSLSKQNTLARKPGGRKYRLPEMLKKLREKRARDAKAHTA